MLTRRHPDCEIHVLGNMQGQCLRCEFVCSDCGAGREGLHHSSLDCIRNLKARIIEMKARLEAMPSPESAAGSAREQSAEDWRKLSVTSVTAENGNVREYIAQLESSLRSISANADFLRKSVGACHMAISRDNLEELRKDKWDPIDLPPRLYKYIGTVMERSAPLPAAREPVAAPGIGNALTEPFNVQKAIVERDKMWEQALQYAAAHYPNVEASFESYMRMVRARLLAPAPAVDRVTIENRYADGKPDAWIVMLDGRYEYGGSGAMGTPRKVAERYAAGLRLELDASRKGQ